MPVVTTVFMCESIDNGRIAGYGHLVGIATQVFRLGQSAGPGGCVHHLLARAGQPSYPNADAGAEEAALAFASSALDHLSSWWVRWRLPADCRSEHAHGIIGETSHVVFDEGLVDDPDLWSGPGLRRVDVWTATSARGGFLVLGAARDDGAFWAAFAGDGDLAGVPLERPAQLISTYFLTDLDGSGDLRDS